MPAVVGGVAAVVSLVVPVRYTATATLVPEAPRRESSLSGGLTALAGQLGLNVPAAEGAASFYVGLLRSRTLRLEVVRSHFPHPGAADSGMPTLVDILEAKGDGEAQRLDAAIRRLQRATRITVDRPTGIVSIAVTTKSASLSAAVANRYLELLNAFNAEKRQASARERRTYVESRTREAEAALAGAEAALRTFLEGNREWANSPQLTFERDRLVRQVAIANDVYLTLRRQYEEVRIQEFDDTPSVVTIDVAVPPVEKSWPPRAVFVLTATFLAFVLTVGALVTRRALVDVALRDQDGLAELARAWRGGRAERRAAL